MQACSSKTATPQRARLDVFAWISFYNNKRRHSTLGYECLTTYENRTHHQPVGLINRVWLCGLRVFVDQPAENRASLNTGRGEVDYLRRWVWWLLVERSVWPVAVVATRKSHVVSELV
jgi:hypothetical protein